MTRHSALLLGLWRFFAARRRPTPVPIRVDPPVPVVEPPPPAIAVPPPAVETPPPAPVSGNGTWTDAGAPTKGYTAWFLLGGGLLLAALAAWAVGSKGGVPVVNIPNIPYFLAALVAVVAVSLHIYTFRVWILPKLKDEGFSATRFGDPSVMKGFYRTVWNFFTVAWLGTAILLFAFAFGDIIPYVDKIVQILIAYWIGIVIVIFVVTALSLGPGDSYIKTLIKAFQWVIVLIMVVLMYWGTQV